jgi:hypothetical protein
VTQAIGASDDLLVLKLDVTDPSDATAAVKAAVEKFGRIDVLVNNAGNFYAGFFEEITPENFRAQIETNLFGPLNVTRAVLPQMRSQRSGLIVTISSTGGLTVSLLFRHTRLRSLDSKVGWNVLRPKSSPSVFGRCLSNPGFFRTELLTEGFYRLSRSIDRRLRGEDERNRRGVEGN